MKNSNRLVSDKYFNIDNGGFSVRVDEYGGIEIEFGFFGYSNTTIYMTANHADNKSFGPRELGDFLIAAANKIEENNKNLIK
jgi:hypothetical protein